MITEMVVVAGAPTAEELAAVVVALDQLAAREAPARARPAWQRAARLEGLNQALVRSAADLSSRRG